MSNTMHENPNIHAQYFTIETTGDNIGQISLNLTACGEDYKELPDVLVIPNEVEHTEVASLEPGMFEGNTRLKELTLPDKVSDIPINFCRNAINLRAIHNTSEIRHIGATAFMNTRIREAWFPSLDTLRLNVNDKAGTFAGCAYLEVANIGNVQSIPPQTFANCALLREVIARNKVTTIGDMAFYLTRSLRELPLLADVTTVGTNAFFNSRICTSLPDGGTIPETAFPTTQHDVHFWSGVPFTPCRNRIVTKLSHQDNRWTDQMPMAPYSNSRALFAVMHIHSAITGKYYSEPVAFVNELASYNIPQHYSDGWKGAIDDVDHLFQTLGYRTVVRGKNTPLDSRDYKALVDALAHGAYVYAQIQTPPSSEEPHGVAIYGINDLGEVCILDSYILHDKFQKSGWEPNIDIYTYTMPYQNLVYPNSDFIIVYPTTQEPVVEWTNFTADNTFTSGSTPSDYPENRVTICRVVGDSGTPGSENGILTAYRVGDSAYRTFVPDGEATLYLQYKGDNDNWSENWTESNQKDFTWLSCNQIVEATTPSEIPLGVSACVVSRTDSGLPDGGLGYLMAYHLQSPDTESGDKVVIIREEWQPIDSNLKYVRYPGSTTPWGAWSVFTPRGDDPQEEGTSNEGQ